MYFARRGKKAITGVADWLLSKMVELAGFPRKGRKSSLLKWRSSALGLQVPGVEHSTGKSVTGKIASYIALYNSLSC